MKTWACRVLAAVLLVQPFPSVGEQPAEMPCVMDAEAQQMHPAPEVAQWPCMHPDAPECTADQTCPAPCAPASSQQACSPDAPVLSGSDVGARFRPMTVQHGPAPWLPPHLRPPIARLS